MSALDALSTAWFNAALRTSWQAAILIALVFAVTRLLRGRLSARWTYALWGLVAVRLLVPVSPRLSLGAFDWDVATGKELATVDMADRAALPPSTLTTSSVSAPRDQVPLEAGGHAAAAARPRSSLKDFSGQFNKPSEAPPTTWTTWTTWAFLVGLLGAVIKFCIVCAQEFAFRRRLRTESVVAPPELQALVDECRADLGLPREVSIVMSELSPSPALAGWRKPVVLLPEHVARLERDELRGVLLHELAHAKHSDVAANALLALLGCVWWFHPLVGFAFDELRAAREALRDREALSTPRSPAPLSYAETLIELAEVRPQRASLAPSFSLETREIRRRIQMIADFRTQSPAAGAIGASLFLALGWLTFTSAATPVALTEVEASKADQSVLVVRHHPSPAWRAKLESALDIQFSVNFEDAACDDVVAFLRELTGENIIVQADLFANYGVDAVTFQANDVQVRDVLALLCEAVDPDVEFALTDQVIYIGEHGSIPLELDLRFYKVDSLLGSDEGDCDIDDLASIIQSFAVEDSWDMNGVMFELWNDLLLVTHTHEAHAEVEALLNRMMRGGERPEGDRDQRQARIEQELQTVRGHFEWDGVPVAEALQQISMLSGVPVRAEDSVSDEFLSLTLNDVNMHQALTWIARRYEVQVIVDSFGVRLGDSPPTHLEFYDLSKLYERVEDRGELYWSLEDLVRNQVEPELWDNDPSACMVSWNQFMLMRATDSAHLGAQRLISALEEVTK